MSCPEDVISLSTLYLKIYFIGMPMTMLYNFSSALLRAVGDTKRPLYCLAAAGIINVVLNLVFVIGFSMSVAGVALATIISQTVSALLVTGMLVREEGALRLDLRRLAFHAGTLKQICSSACLPGCKARCSAFPMWSSSLPSTPSAPWWWRATLLPPIWRALCTPP